MAKIIFLNYFLLYLTYSYFYILHKAIKWIKFKLTGGQKSSEHIYIIKELIMYEMVTVHKGFVLLKDV